MTQHTQTPPQLAIRLTRPATKASLAPQTRTSIMALLILVALAAGCGSHDDNPGGAEEQTPSAFATSPSEQPGTDQPADISPLVGTWERTQRCAELVKVLTDNGLEGSILPTLAGDGWIPGVTRAEQIAELGHPCKDAVSRKHSHFFTADGSSARSMPMASRSTTGATHSVAPTRWSSAA